MEIISVKGLIKNLIVSLILGLVIPLIIIYILSPLMIINGLFLEEGLIANGILFIIVYTAFGMFKKDTIIRFFIGIGYIILLIYFYTVGFTAFTGYLPMCSFGTFCISAEIGGISASFSLDIWWVFLIILSLKSLNLIRHIIKPPKED
jgi:hypothetical protein